MLRFVVRALVALFAVGWALSADAVQIIENGSKIEILNGQIVVTSPGPPGAGFVLTTPSGNVLTTPGGNTLAGP
ncbi:MAG: hypothetical protein ABI196_00670 [Bradyrhizobium sp.]